MHEWRRLPSDKARRRSLSELVGFSVTDGMWGELVVGGEAEAIEGAECGADEKEALNRAAQRIHELRDVFGGGMSSPSTVPSPVAERTDPDPGAEYDVHATNRSSAVSCALAAGARTLPGVIDFRRDVLRGHLVAVDDVDDWIQNRLAEWAKSNPLSVPHFDNKFVDLGPFLLGVRFAVRSRRFDTAPDGLRDSKGLIRVFPLEEQPREPDKDPLNWMADVVDDLMRQFDWSEQYAVEFALADVVPPMRIRTVPGIRPVSSGKHWLTDITMTIPIWATSADVTNAWGDARREELGPRGVQHFGEITDRWAAVAEFVYQRLDISGNPIGGWDNLRREWNATLPEGDDDAWTFARTRQFSSNFRRLERTLSGTRYKTKSKEH